MNRFGKISYGILFCLMALLVIITEYKYERIPRTQQFYILFGAFIFVPPILSYLLKYIFRNAENQFRFQWIPNTLTVLSIIFLLLLDGVGMAIPLSNSEKMDLEQKHLEKAVTKWIQDNAQYPDSYQACEDTDYYSRRFMQVSKPVMKSDFEDPEPIGYYIKEHPQDIFKYAYYFLKHKHIIKSRSGSLDTVVVYFRMTTDLKVMDVSFTLGDPPPTTSNSWRSKYGNNLKTLALELNGNSNKTYYFSYFDGGNMSKESIVPYSDGKINGIMYCLYENEDTNGKFTYKDGLRNGPGMEICPNTRIAFKGNCINGQFYGLSTWWYCNGQKQTEGMRVKDIEVGIWKTWDENGSLIKTEDKGNEQLLDSIPKTE